MDLEKTQHYTTNANIILQNIIDYLPMNELIVEPFVGKGDLLPYINSKSSLVECYDIDSSIGIKQDTLMNPPCYKNKWVVTNPPYMAKNKNDDKSIYDKYNEDDLYKIAIKTIINGDAKGGILIIPINFLTDENTEHLRKQFFEKYCIKHINYFIYPIFDSTGYSICSFFFEKGTDYQTRFCIYDKNGLKDSFDIILKERLFQEFYDKFNIKPIVSRVTSKNIDNATHIKIYCIDNKKSIIRAEYNENIFVGKDSDRTFFTMTQPNNKKLSEENQKKVVDIFNNYVNIERNNHYNLLFTNYRENNRKRIGFDLAYSILTTIIESL